MSGRRNMKKIVLLILLLLVSLVWLSAAETIKNTPLKMKPALLVIDIQNAYLPRMDEKDTKTAMEMINYFIALFRENGFPVIRVYHTDLKMGPNPGSDEFEFPKTVATRDDDPKIIKNYGNAFKKTELDKLLKAKGCNTLFLCGLSAVGCVISTYFGANELDYNVFMLEDALISHDASLTKAVQEITKTIGYYPLKLMLDNICK
jgi:nicotinamidase-related amidase